MPEVPTKNDLSASVTSSLSMVALVQRAKERSRCYSKDSMGGKSSEECDLQDVKRQFNSEKVFFKRKASVLQETYYVVVVSCRDSGSSMPRVYDSFAHDTCYETSRYSTISYV